MQVKKQQLELDMEKWTGSKLGKEYIKAVYCHSVYLMYMQSTSCEMLDWMKHKLESRLQGEISINSDMQMTPPLQSLLFSMLSRLVISFLPRSKRLLISWLQSPSAVILEPRKVKSDTVSIVSPSICHKLMGPDAMILVFRMLSFKPTFSLLFHLHQDALFSLHFLP